MTASDMVPEEHNANAEQVMESLGEPAAAADDVNQSTQSAHAADSPEPKNDPLYVQKRLKQQSRQHEREMRAMQSQLAQMQAQMGQSQPQLQMQNEPMVPGSDDHIQRAVNAALAQRELQERKQKEAESAAHVQRQYKELQKHLDNVADKYDDFHDHVFSDETPFTPAMRDYAITLPRQGNGSAGEVLYHLAKNKEELRRISKLHPVDQAAEMSKLSHALISGAENKANPQKPNLGNIKSTPVNVSRQINDKTPVSSIRAAMKSGTWK